MELENVEDARGEVVAKFPDLIYSIDGLCSFMRGTKYYDMLKDNSISIGYFNYWFVLNYYDMFGSLRFDGFFKTSDFLVVLDDLKFDNIVFLINCLLCKVSKDYLLDNCSLASVYNPEEKVMTIIQANFLRGLNFLFSGISSDFFDSVPFNTVMGQINDYTYKVGEDNFNYITNVLCLYPYFLREEKKDSNRDDSNAMMLPIEKIIPRVESMVKRPPFVGKNKISDECSHGGGVRNLPLLEFFDEIVEEIDYIERSKDEESELFEMQLKNGTKNALSILHFIDYYRDVWSDVRHVYVIGVANNPHLLAFADFFPDIFFHYYDPGGFHREYKTNRINVEFVSEEVGFDMSFESRSVIVSDIRTDTSDLSVINDYRLQMKWSLHPNVLFGTYKFRYPYEVDMELGHQVYDDIYLQCFKNSDSQECRLYVSKGSSDVLKISRIVYDRRNAYFNSVRFNGSSCNDCRMFQKILSCYTVLPFAWAIMFGFPMIKDLKRMLLTHDMCSGKVCSKYLQRCPLCIRDVGD